MTNAYELRTHFFLEDISVKNDPSGRVGSLPVNMSA